MTTIVLTTEQVQTLTFTPQTLLGKPSQIEAGSLSVTTVSGNATAQVLSDQDVKFLSEDDLLGATSAESEFDVEGDADLGEGVTKIVERVKVVVTVPSAIGFGVQAGAVEPKVAPTV